MTAPHLVVPDSSVLLKWVLDSEDEHDRERALDLRDSWLSGRCSIIVPSLWFYEVGNILGLKQPKLASELMQILTAFRFQEEAPSALHKTPFDLMARYKVTFYDAVYHATAISHAGVMLTADAAYVRKTRNAGHVQLLGEWTVSSTA